MSYVDLQVNGYKNVNFSSPELTEDAFLFACRELVASGTDVFLPTIITSPLQAYEHNLPLIAGMIQTSELRPHIPGIHLEGPFLANDPQTLGAHRAEFVLDPQPQMLDFLYKLAGESLKMITVSANVPGMNILVKHAVEYGIAISLGHHMATDYELRHMVEAGATCLTHLGNGIPRLLDRHHNPVWAGLANDDLYAMIITDGHHIPASFIKTVIRTKGVSRTIVTSDCAPVSGMPPGVYNNLGHDAVLQKDGKLFNPETGYLEGSSSTMSDCMSYLKSLNILNDEELAKVGRENPLEVIR